MIKRAVNIARKVEKHYTYSILVGKSEEKVSHGRFGFRKYGQEFVNTILKLRVP
jgi:hypothetical protein